MENDYKIKITKQAFSQLKEIKDYISIELMAPEAADNLMDQIQHDIATLSELPKRYKFIEEDPWRSEGVRKLIVKNFLVYYWIDERNREVHVIAVIYEKCDQLRQLSKISIE